MTYKPQESGFAHRQQSYTITREWITRMVDAPETVVMDRIAKAVRRFERTYNAVAMMETTNNGNGGKEVTIRAISARDAEQDEIRRGLQSIQHWVLNDER